MVVVKGGLVDGSWYSDMEASSLEGRRGLCGWLVGWLGMIW